jgi:hypothetical protein
MIWHPLVMIISLLDMLTIVLVSLAALHSLRIMTLWAPQSASRLQIQLEIESESAVIQQKWGAGLFLFSTLFYIVGIAVIFPTLVPGAMCGTGVIQATQGLGWKALILRFGGVAFFYLLHVTDQLNALDPRSPLSIAHARLSLIATPVIFMAFGYTSRSLWQLDTHEPVSCCTVVYDQVGGVVSAPWIFNVNSGIWVGLFLLGGAGLLFACYYFRRKLKKDPVPLAWAILVLTFSWVPIAAMTLVFVLAAYHYEVLQHHCPWCLLLFEHHHIGFLLFGCLYVTAAEGGLPIFILSIVKPFPQLEKAALMRLQTAVARTIVSIVLFTTLAGMPAIIWRLRYGVWMG